MAPQEAEMILLLAKTGEPSIPFGTAFQAARVLGRGDFQWQGKPYKAQTAAEARGQPRLPRGMKESDLYRDPAQERINRDYYDRTQQIEKDYQQKLRAARQEIASTGAIAGYVVRCGEPLQNRRRCLRRRNHPDDCSQNWEAGAPLKKV